MESEIGKRINEIIKHNEMNPNSFSVKVGTTDSVIRNIVKGKNNPSYEMLHRILDNFANISPEWLLTGTGDMLFNENDRYISIKGNNNKIGDDPSIDIPNNSENENFELRARIRLLEKEHEIRFAQLERLLEEKDRVIKIQSDFLESLKKNE